MYQVKDLIEGCVYSADTENKMYDRANMLLNKYEDNCYAYNEDEITIVVEYRRR